MLAQTTSDGVGAAAIFLWIVVLFIIPIVGFVILIITYVDLARVFGKGGGFVVGLVFLSWIFLMILAFGSAMYQSPGSPAAASPAAPRPDLPA